MQKNILKWIIFCIWAVALISSLGSLFFSEILEYTLCELCWYQRVFMFSLCIILTIGIIKGDNGVVYYVVPLSVIGGVVATYHYIIQMTNMKPSHRGVILLILVKHDCLNWLGFITIPFLSMVAFWGIGALSVMYFYIKNKVKPI